MRGRRSLVIAIAVSSVLLLTGCGGQSAKTQARPSLAAMLHPKIMEHPGGNPDAVYVPDPIRIRVGQTVTWTNEDSEPHDVTSFKGMFNSGPIGLHGTFRWKAPHPGTYRYICTIHPEMHGEIIVQSS